MARLTTIKMITIKDIACVILAVSPTFGGPVEVNQFKI